MNEKNIIIKYPGFLLRKLASEYSEFINEIKNLKN